MGMTGDKMVAEARTWFGTPWHHQACLKGVGVDCVGLVRASYEAATGQKIDLVFDYHKMPPVGREERLAQTLSQYAVEISKNSLEPGDILLFHFLGGMSNHVGIYAGEGKFIHAWMTVGKVVEMPLDAVWQRALGAAFRVPEVRR